MPSKTKPDATPVPSQQDVDMPDAGAQVTVGEQERKDEEDNKIAASKIKILPGATETAASYELKNEDHTLGNALRWMLMKNPEVEFCGYSIPHPSEPKMNIRIQTHSPYTPRQALAKGLDDIVALCDVVSEKYVEAKEKFSTDGASSDAQQAAT